MEEDTTKQYGKRYDWLKPYQFKKGQVANPNGRPKGKSLKTFVREMLEEMEDEDKIEFLSKIDPELAWKMAEGNPQTNVEASGNITIKVIDFDGDNSPSQLSTEAVPDRPAQSQEKIQDSSVAPQSGQV